MNIEIIGSLAAFLTTTCSLPQLYHLARTKNTISISLPCYLMLWTGIMLWLVYGLKSDQMPIIIGNSVSLLSISSIIFLKIRYR